MLLAPQLFPVGSPPPPRLLACLAGNRLRKTPLQLVGRIAVHGRQQQVEDRPVLLRTRSTQTLGHPRCFETRARAGRICLLSKERGQGRLVSPNSGAMSDLSIAAKPYVPVARASPELRRSPTTVFHEPLYSLSPALPPHLSPGRPRSPDLMQLRPQLSPPPAPPPPAPFEHWLQHAASVALANPLSRPVPAWA